MGSSSEMKYLLDTHILIWGVLEPERLSKNVIGVLKNPENQFWISSISIWEIMLLIEKGRIRVSTLAQDWIKQVLEKTNLKSAPLTNEIAIRSCLIKLPHKDPADRFIAATAFLNGFTLITADKKIAQTDDIEILFNS